MTPQWPLPAAVGLGARAGCSLTQIKVGASRAEESSSVLGDAMVTGQPVSCRAQWGSVPEPGSTEGLRQGGMSCSPFWTFQYLVETPKEYSLHFGQVEGDLLQGGPGVTIEVGQRLPASWGMGQGSHETPTWKTGGDPPRASPGPLLPLQLTVQQNPKDGLEVLTCHLPQCKGLSGRLGEQAQEEDDRVLWGQGGQVDVAVGNRRGTAGPRGGGTLETESRVLGAGLGSVSSGTPLSSWPVRSQGEQL